MALLAAAAAGGEEGGEADEVSPELLEVLPKSLEGFVAGMNDDLNTPRYISTAVAEYIMTLTWHFLVALRCGACVRACMCVCVRVQLRNEVEQVSVDTHGGPWCGR